MPKPKSVVLIDGDIPVYKTVFACVDEQSLWKVQHTAKKQLEHICHLAGASHYIGFMTYSPDNFRIARATTWPYKGDRKDKRDPPAWYHEVREYYAKNSGFQTMHGVEADDALTIAAEVLKEQGYSVSCATIDKDLKQYPWDIFVDLNKDTLYSISEEEAHRNLWKQMLIGDKTDNIPGLSHAAKYQTTGEFEVSIRASKDHLVGDKGAEKLLDSWDPSEYADRVFEMYVDAYDGMSSEDPVVEEFCRKNGICFGTYRFYETWDLIYMLKEAPEGLEINYDLTEVPLVTLGAVSVFEDYT